MLEGWYCRSLANQEEGAVKDEPLQQESDEEQPTRNIGQVHARGVGAGAPASSSSASAGIANNANNVDYKDRYKNLKRKLKFLIYENEYFQDLLHTNQRRLLKVSRDRTFLLDRLLLYEHPAKDSSDSEATDSSDSETEQATPSTSTAAGGLQTPRETIRKKHKEKGTSVATATPPHQPTVGATRGRRRKVLTGALSLNHGVQAPGKRQLTATVPPSQQSLHSAVSLSTAEITRQLQERRPTPIELMSPECTSATVPTTMLSDESPSKCYPNESLHHLMEDDSHSQEVAAEECVAMEYTN
ncbi:INO80 complex subunit E [Drosophila madeirensis]|uniref:INO80 complex subunit E n=1 Tax=Drosophila madeirensis TaxID=30013 RepID=A0AAU9G6P8_DROMD